MLCLAPRRVSFLAKSTLFRMPVISFFVRALDSLPVYRRQDKGEDITRNRETFEKARALLVRGGTIAICPEGVSHNETRLKPLKTGAARIALGAASAGEQLYIQIVPAGLYYTAKKSFRSSALLYFGEPIKVEPAALDEDGDPPREAVKRLSEKIERALRDVILEAEHEEALMTISRAERIFSSVDQYLEDEPQLERELALRQRFVAGYAFHHARSPERLAALEARIKRFEEELKQTGLGIEDLSTPSATRLKVAGHLLIAAFVSILLAPLAFIGALLHYPAYRLAGYFATRFAHNQDDVVSTIKIIAAMLLFPLTWITLAALLFIFESGLMAVLCLIFMPLAGYAAMRFFEEWDRFIGGARAVAYFLMRRRFFIKLLAERRAIREEILALAEESSARTR